MPTRNAPNAAALLRRLRPDLDYDPDAPATLARLDRLLAAPPERPSRQRSPRRRTRRVLVAGTVAVALGVGGVTALPLAPGGVDVVAEAVAVLKEPNKILHYRASVQTPGGGGVRTLESWQAAGGRQERTLYDGQLEMVDDWDLRTKTSYNAERDEIVRHTDPDYFQGTGPAGVGEAAPFSTTTLGDLARLLERARSGDQGAELVGETTINEVPVYEIRIAVTVPIRVAPAGNPQGDPRKWPIRQETLTTTLFIDRDDYLPVRLVERGPGARVMRTFDYDLAERIERTSATEGLLQMAPHPGAKVTDEGPFR